MRCLKGVRGEQYFSSLNAFHRSTNFLPFPRHILSPLPPLLTMPPIHIIIVLPIAEVVEFGQSGAFFLAGVRDVVMCVRSVFTLCKTILYRSRSCHWHPPHRFIFCFSLSEWVSLLYHHLVIHSGLRSLWNEKAGMVKAEIWMKTQWMIEMWNWKFHRWISHRNTNFNSSSEAFPQNTCCYCCCFSPQPSARGGGGICDDESAFGYPFITPPRQPMPLPKGDCPSFLTNSPLAYCFWASSHPHRFLRER